MTGNISDHHKHSVTPQDVAYIVLAGKVTRQQAIEAIKEAGPRRE